MICLTFVQQHQSQATCHRLHWDVSVIIKECSFCMHHYHDVIMFHISVSYSIASFLIFHDIRQRTVRPSKFLCCTNKVRRKERSIAQSLWYTDVISLWCRQNRRGGGEGGQGDVVAGVPLLVCWGNSCRHREAPLGDPRVMTSKDFEPENQSC